MDAEYPTANEGGTLQLPGAGARDIRFRPILPTDQDALQRFHDQLSAQSIHQRFFGAMPHLGDEQARHFTQVDGINRCALVALHPADGSELIGVARYDREGTSSTAEYACIIADRWQGLGLGTALTHALIRTAQANGIETMIAIVLPNNHQMLDVLSYLGYPVQTSWDDDVARVALDLRPAATPLQPAAIAA